MPVRDSFFCVQILDARLDARVDTMVKFGLAKEVEDMYSLLTKSSQSSSSSAVRMQTESNQSSPQLNYEYGICQSLGFKEFESYLRLKFQVCLNSL
jgi:tRNA A37 N6-isopentenylltransferase MiaA